MPSRDRRCVVIATIIRISCLTAYCWTTFLILVSFQELQEIVLMITTNFGFHQLFHFKKLWKPVKPPLNHACL